MKTSMSYGGLTCPPGKKIRGFLPLFPTGEQFPATLINGTHAGPTVLISSGIHGSEYPGILTAMELARELSPTELLGQLLIFHPVNTGAFFKRLDYINPVVGENLNRFYPGRPDGSVAEQVAHYMGQEYHRRVDFVLDLHGGDLHEALPPYVYTPGVGSPEVLAASRAMAELVSAEYLVESTCTTGFYNSCAMAGTPAILIERGSCGLWSRKEVDLYKSDVRNLLTHLGLLCGTVKKPAHPAHVLKTVVYLDAGATGVWLPAVSLNEPVQKGQLLGTITDPFGTVLEEIHAEFDAVVLMLATSLGVAKGVPILTYGI